MNENWWRQTTIYHIYPRSFQDSNNDGIGDLQGIINRLDYLKELGIETIWISPFFASPEAQRIILKGIGIYGSRNRTTGVP
ncbi:MAG: alpha-amylase family glycosyl hydrolase [Spirochaetaceae bacterium]|jgi:pullulanase/glycogen debranching enzyme|nr:alpha-amylase family glycosyl hydrolase [Spirochaetaceae bacterium]